MEIDCHFILFSTMFYLIFILALHSAHTFLQKQSQEAPIYLAKDSPFFTKPSKAKNGIFLLYFYFVLIIFKINLT